MQPLPPLYVATINAAERGGVSDDLLEAWHDYEQQTRQQLGAQSEYVLSEEDAALQQHLPLQLQQAATAVRDGAAAEALMDTLAELAQNLDRFFELRRQQFFVSIPALDQLLCAGVATVQGRAKEGAVEGRLHPAAQAVGALEQRYQEIEEELPREVQEAVDRGFEQVERGFGLVESWLDGAGRDALEEALFRLKSGGELLDHIVAWFTEAEERSAAESAVPIVGPLLGPLRRSFEPALLALLRDQKLPELVQFWGESAATMPVCPAALEEVFPAIDETLGELEELLEQDSVEEQPLWQSLERLESLFAELKEQRLPVEELMQSGYAPEASLLLTALHGGVPDLVLRRAAASMQDPQAPSFIGELGQRLQAYLSSADELLLLDGLAALADEAHRAANEVECPACGQSSAIAQKCEHCGAELPRLAISG